MGLIVDQKFEKTFSNGKKETFEILSFNKENYLVDYNYDNKIKTHLTFSKQLIEYYLHNTKNVKEITDRALQWD